MTYADCSLEHVFDIEIFFGADRFQAAFIAGEAQRVHEPGLDCSREESETQPE